MAKASSDLLLPVVCSSLLRELCSAGIKMISWSPGSWACMQQTLKPDLVRKM